MKPNQANGIYDADFVIIGSGFGGSVAALRLTEKGYKVVVLEAGRRFADHDFPKTNWNLRRFFFLPWLGLQGILRLDFFQGLTILSGAGVGGGSLVYANTLIEPPEESFKNWPSHLGISDWYQALHPHYLTAKRMLGATPAKLGHTSENLLKNAARTMGVEHTYHGVDVGVFYGNKPGQTVPDPYFDGEGPRRTGCTECGGCMIGCRVGAKNTLTKNYLYLAEKKGAGIIERAQVFAVKPQNLTGSHGYEIFYRSPGIFFGPSRKVKAKEVIFAGGVLGTLKLLFSCRDVHGSLANISQKLGFGVRTNGESILGVRKASRSTDFSRGVAIAAGFNPTPQTKIEAVRYPRGSDAMAFLIMPLLDAATIPGRILQFAKQSIRNPWKVLRQKWPIGFAQETIILLVMQTIDSQCRFKFQRRFTSLFQRTLAADFSQSGRPPVKIPEGDACAKIIAQQSGGDAGGTIADVLGMSFTAHILGGCPMGSTADEGVIDNQHRVFNYTGLYVLAGASIPANLGVNPSLTITAMAERAMSLIPDKSSQDS